MALGEVWEGFGEDLRGSWEDFSQFCDAILSIWARFLMASNDPNGERRDGMDGRMAL